jgi:hypothetical protein
MRVWWVVLMLGCAVAVAQKPAGSSFVAGTAEDEAAIRGILKVADDDEPSTHVAADLDWENAFGVRYMDLKRRDAFYHQFVTPLQTKSTFSVLEVKVKFVNPETAVADEYWRIVGQLNSRTGKTGADRWGRTTYVFAKAEGRWTEVLERITDLRLPYFKHYETRPEAVKLPEGTLERLAGKYEVTEDHSPVTMTVEGDHLIYAGPKRSMIAVPVSATEFLLFERDDAEEYTKLEFGKDAAGKTTVGLLSAWGAPFGTLERVP